MELLDPKSDFVFKKLFAQAPALLSELINAVRSTEPPVQVIEVLNPTITPQELTGKFIVLDVLAQDELRDRRRSHVRLGDELELNLIELRKADRLAGDGAQSGVSTALAAWVTFMEHWQEEARMAQIDYPPVQQALARVRELSADEETRRLAFVRERAVRDERSALRGAREEGRLEGRLEGKLEGKLEGQTALLERQLIRRFGLLSESFQTRLRAASADELARWADRILDATDLEGVFLAD